MKNHMSQQPSSPTWKVHNLPIPLRMDKEQSPTLKTNITLKLPASIDCPKFGQLATLSLVPQSNWSWCWGKHWFHSLQSSGGRHIFQSRQAVKFNLKTGEDSRRLQLFLQKEVENNPKGSPIANNCTSLVLKTPTSGCRSLRSESFDLQTWFHTCRDTCEDIPRFTFFAGFRI